MPAGPIAPGSLTLVPLGTGSSTVDIDVYRVTDTIYGAIGDGVTDDTAAIQAAIDACCITGGIVYLPAGTFKITSTLDFSAMAGSHKGVAMMGAGSGSYGYNWLGTTAIDSYVGGTAIMAKGTPTNPIPALGFRDFTIRNSQSPTAGVYTMDFDVCQEHMNMTNVHINGGNLFGNGIRHLNFATGQSVWDSVTVSYCYGGTGFHFANEVTANCPTGIECGNITVNSCAAFFTLVGFDVLGDIIGMVFNGSKVVNFLPSTAGSIGFRLSNNSTGGARNNVLVAPHVEAARTGYYISANSTGNNIISPLMTCDSSAVCGADVYGQHNTISRLAIGTNGVGNIPVGAILRAGSLNNHVTAHATGTGPTTMFSDLGTTNLTGANI